MGYLNKTQIAEYTGNTFSITYDGDHIRFTDSNGSFYNDGRYIEQGTSEISHFSGSTALVVGLGIGVIPQWLATEKSCQVDVLEINPELISKVNEMNYLSEPISIIEGDVFNYETTKSYDLIVFDIWFDKYGTAPNDKIFLENAFSNNSNNIIFPFLT